MVDRNWNEVPAGIEMLTPADHRSDLAVIRTGPPHLARARRRSTTARRRCGGVPLPTSRDRRARSGPCSPPARLVRIRTSEPSGATASAGSCDGPRLEVGHRGRLGGRGDDALEGRAPIAAASRRAPFALGSFSRWAWIAVLPDVDVGTVSCNVAGSVHPAGCQVIRSRSRGLTTRNSPRAPRSPLLAADRVLLARRNLRRVPEPKVRLRHDHLPRLGQGARRCCVAHRLRSRPTRSGPRGAYRAPARSRPRSSGRHQLDTSG